MYHIDDTITTGEYSTNVMSIKDPHINQDDRIFNEKNIG